MWAINALRLLLITSATLFSAQGFSQQFDAGFSAGLTGSQISGDNLAGFNKLGFTAGIFSTVYLKDDIDLQIEMNFIQKGSRKRYDAEDPYLPYYRLHLNYVEIPLFLRYYHKKFLFEGGLSYARLISSREEDISGVLPPTIPFNRGEVAGHLGIGTKILPKLNMVWRYSNSILPARPHAGNATFMFNRGQYTSLLQVVFQYRFRERG